MGNYEICFITLIRQEAGIQLLNILVGLTCTAKAEKLIEYGFANYHKDYYFFERELDHKLSFRISINSKTLKIENIDLTDDWFLQPAPTSEALNKKIKEIIDDMIRAEILKKDHINNN